MANNHFTFKQFTIRQEKCAFKVGTDSVILGSYADIHNVSEILDIGTGSGLIAIMLAQRCNALITAIEPDEESYRQAVENVKISKWNNRVHVIKTDLQTFSASDHKFDLIVSNPPYFTDSLRNPDERKANTRHTDSLLSSDLLNGVKTLLSENSKFQVIMPYVEGNLLIAEASDHGLYCNDLLKIRPTPTSGIKRMIITFSHTKKIVSEKFLTIEQGKRHDFTDEYKNLTKDFYLKF